jgi:hypothetical protein
LCCATLLQSSDGHTFPTPKETSKAHQGLACMIAYESGRPLQVLEWCPRNNPVRFLLGALKASSCLPCLPHAADMSFPACMQDILLPHVLCVQSSALISRQECPAVDSEGPLPGLALEDNSTQLLMFHMLLHRRSRNRRIFECTQQGSTARGRSL